MFMSITELKALPTQQKFQIMEFLWEDLSEKVEEIPLSETQKSLLDSRLERLSSGEAKVLDWDAVKDSLTQR